MINSPVSSHVCYSVTYKKILLLHGNITLISYLITQVNMRDGKNEANSLCDVIILSLLYWCHGLVLFLFGSLHLSWLFTGVCPDGDGFDTPRRTWFSQISTQKDPAWGVKQGVLWVGDALPNFCQWAVTYTQACRHAWCPH